jgi:hypothetical protein
MEKITFQPNVPVRMALKYAGGKTVEGRFGDQEYYTLTDGRCMYVNPDVAEPPLIFFAVAATPRSANSVRDRPLAVRRGGTRHDSKMPLTTMSAAEL